MECRTTPILIIAALALCHTATLKASENLSNRNNRPTDRFHGLREINPPFTPGEENVIAIVGAALVDGRGGKPIPDAVVLIRANRIVAVGPRRTTIIPELAQLMNASGMTVLPGLLDAHLHVYEDRRFREIGTKFLPRGVTSFRDPGRPDDIYEFVPGWPDPLPRCFATGPHFDGTSPTYPENAIVIESAEMARSTVDHFMDQGASSVKVYNRLPAELIRATCERAHDYGIPVTAHLDMVRADRAILAGLDGIEHTYAFGTCLVEASVANEFQQAFDAASAEEQRVRISTQKALRYRLWANLDLTSDRIEPLLRLVKERGVFFTPTLNAVEHRDGDKNVTLDQVRGFQKMMEFVGRCHKAGVTLVNGSHTISKYVPKGWAYQREMELLVECGLTPLEAITVSTLNTALFLGCHERLGSLEVGKLADLVLVAGHPHEDIRAMYDIQRVMLNGVWIEELPTDAPQFNIDE